MWFLRMVKGISRSGGRFLVIDGQVAKAANVAVVKGVGKNAS